MKQPNTFALSDKWLLDTVLQQDTWACLTWAGMNEAGTLRGSRVTALRAGTVCVSLRGVSTDCVCVSVTSVVSDSVRPRGL